MNPMAAKIQGLRFTAEVSHPKFMSVIKRPPIKILDTIDEEKAYASTLLSSFFVKVPDQETYHRQVSVFE